jgi:hypothetical protein
MRANYCIRVPVFLLAALALPVCALAQAPSQVQTSTEKVTSAQIGTVNLCPKTLWTIDQMPGCKRVEATPEEIKLAKDAMDIVNAIVRSNEFKNAVLIAKYDPKQMQLCPKQVCSGPQLTPQQVYDLMVQSSPQTLNVTYYTHHRPDKGNQGFESTSALDTVFGNLGKIKGDRGFLASLILHEWMHVLGFIHDTDTGPMCKSVPYEMNVIYEKVAPLLHQPPSTSGCTNQQ